MAVYNRGIVYDRRLGQGKTKVIFGTYGDPFTCRIYSKDNVTAGNGARNDKIPGKGVASNVTAINLFKLLEEAGVPTHFVRWAGARSFIARRCVMIPIEWVGRWEVAEGSSILKRRTELVAGHRFDTTNIEMYWKEDSLDDPLLYKSGDGVYTASRASMPVGEGKLTEVSSLALGLDVDSEQRMYWLTSWIAASLHTLLEPHGIVLQDFKVEFGRDLETGEIMLADVITNDEWRILRDGRIVSKQWFRNNTLDTPDKVAHLTGLYKEIADLSGRLAYPLQD
ncbi:hypothetical protein HOI83_00520 [Candidatus Uhrbacteria bacterium]|nr:hypothetical protein [Candidatus Uhrbacteria bacterium]